MDRQAAGPADAVLQRAAAPRRRVDGGRRPVRAAAADRSFYGREDLPLEDELAAELPGILNWALDGLERLAEQGRFTRPPSVDDTVRTLQDLASPVGAFVRDCCEMGADGRSRSTTSIRRGGRGPMPTATSKSTKQVFGRDLRAPLGGRLKVTQPGSGDNRAARLPRHRRGPRQPGGDGCSRGQTEYAMSCARTRALRARVTGNVTCARDARVFCQLTLNDRGKR